MATLTSGAGTYTEVVDSGSWSGTVDVDGTETNGVKVSIDTTAAGLSTDGTESTLGGVGAAEGEGEPDGNADPPGGDDDAVLKFTVKLAGVELGADIELTGDSTAKDIATAVYDKITEANADGEITINGATYKVTDGGNGKLTFALQDEPTKDNIEGNFSWTFSGISGGTINGAHTGGTYPTKAGAVASEAQTANTVFEIKQSDKEYFFENLMIASALYLDFPNLTSPETLWKSYVALCNLYSLYRFVSVVGCKENATKERLFHMIVMASRDTLHNRNRFNGFQEDLFQHDSSTLAHMAILLR